MPDASAEEVGVAVVSLYPSARNFSKNAQREISKDMRGRKLAIPIVPELDHAAVMAAFTGTSAGARVRVPVDVEVDRRQVTAAFASVSRTERLSVDADVSTSDLIGDTRRAVRATQATNPTVRVDVDVDRPGFLRRLLRIDVDSGGRGLGERIGESAGKGFLSRFTGLLGNLPTSPILIAAGAAIGAALLVPISAAITGGLLGGAGLGLIGIGAWILKDEPAVREAATSLALTVGSVFRSAAIPLIAPIADAVEMIRWAVIRWGPQFRTMFELIAPAIKPLTEGLIGMISNMLPGFTELIRQATPFLIDLAGALPQLGEHIGGFFRIIDGGGPQASQFFKDLLTLLGLGILAFGAVIRVATELYPVFRMLVGSSVIGMFLQLTNAAWKARDSIGAFASRVIEVIRGLPGRIKSAVGSLGNLLYNAGRNVVQGLIDGIKSKFGSLANIASSLASTIRNYLPFSPAKVGPLSGSGSPFRSGQAIARDLAGGMSASLPAVASAGDQLAGAVGVGGRSGSSAAALPPVVLGFDGAAGDSFVEWMREHVRARFGSAAADNLTAA